MSATKTTRDDYFRDAWKRRSSGVVVAEVARGKRVPIFHCTSSVEACAKAQEWSKSSSLAGPVTYHVLRAYPERMHRIQSYRGGRAVPCWCRVCRPARIAAARVVEAASSR